MDTAWHHDSASTELVSLVKTQSSHDANTSDLSLEIDRAWHLDSESTEFVSLVNPISQSTPTDIHTRTGENRTKKWLLAITPLILHFTSALLIAAILRFRIDRHDFNLNSRSALTNFTPLQSDITTAVSSGVTIVRFFVAMWLAAMTWRCIFILMEKEGISLQQIDILLTAQIHFLPRRNSSTRIGLLVSIILLLSFPCQLSGPILTGSITWSSSNGFIEGGNLPDIPTGYIGDFSDPDFIFRFPLNFSDSEVGVYSVGAQSANGYAINAWQGSRDDQKTMKRIVLSAFTIPINSTLNNITLPYFAISELEWIKDPVNELPPAILQSFGNNTNWNPFVPGFNLIGPAGTFAIIPDSWGVVSPPPPYNGIVTETRYIAGIIGTYTASCQDSPFGDLPANIGQYNGSYFGCYIYGRITYVAGATECQKCRISSWLTVQNDTELTVSPDNTTLFAIGLMPMVGTMMTLQNLSLPGTYNNLDEYVTELFIRSYGASWSLLNYFMQFTTEFLATDVQIAVPTSRANVMWWRVVLWLTLNMMFTLSGLLFLAIQRTCDQPLIGQPSLAALLLDTTEVQHKRNRALCDFSTLVADDKDIGYLYLHKTKEGTHKRVEILEH